MMEHDIFGDLQWRGLVYQTTDEKLGDWLRGGPRVVYAGFDPTADSLHAGSLLPLMTLRRFQRAGHRPVALVGGATGMIGDPSGKSAERNLLSPDDLQANIAGIARQMQAFLDFDERGTAPAILVNNHDWIGQFSFVEFLRDVGKNFSVNVMLSKDSVRNRIEGDTGISYTEFSYMLLQAYDFVHLNRAFGCQLQIGGSDQWGNITAGIDLGRRMQTGALYGLTCPLLTKSDGSKMGKTESGTIWLSAARTSPYQFYQYWMNVADADVGMCLRFLTELTREEIEALDRERESNAAARDSQKRLAESLTQLVHGPSGLRAAQAATQIFFGETIANLSDLELTGIFADVPRSERQMNDLKQGQVQLLDLLVETQLCKSKAEARRGLGEGSIYLNNRRVSEDLVTLAASHLASESCLVLRRGKKNYAVVRFV